MTFQKIFNEEKINFRWNDLLKFTARSITTVGNVIAITKLPTKNYEYKDREYSHFRYLFSELLDRINQRYVDYLSDFTKLFEELSAFYSIRVIRDAHYHKWIWHCSTSQDENSGLQPFFGKVFTAEGVGFKPSPQILNLPLMILQKPLNL